MAPPGLPGRPRRDGSISGEGRPSLRERMAALRHLPPMLRLVWETHRPYAVVMVALRLVRALVPLAFLWVGKLIVDEVVRLAQAGGGDRTRLWQLLVLEVGIALGGELLSRASGLVESLLGDLFSNRISLRIMEHAATLDLAYFEDPTFYDHLDRARRHTSGRIVMVTQLLGMGMDLITLLSLGGALVAYSPLLLLLLVVAVLPSFLSEGHFAALQYSLMYRYTPQRRELDYVRFVGASDQTAKEVQMFGLAPWLAQRFRGLADRFYHVNRRLAVRRALVSAALSIVSTLGYYGAYASILLRTVGGAISVGTLTFLAGAFARARDLVQRILSTINDFLEQALYLRDLFVFLEMQPTIASRRGAPPVPRPLREGFAFEDVGFRYPGSERWAVRHVNMTLRPGERVALVGENGAGKTTLTKLLARLYDPSEGRILLDGVDLRDYDLASLRRAIGVIFQDFVRYDMRFDENVAVGEITAVRDYVEAGRDRDIEAETRGVSAKSLAAGANGSAEPLPVPAPIVSAAEESLAASVLPRLPGGYRQMLGRRFEGGVDLSGGEWQKLALARAYMRDAQVLILDEPTAALDARAEFEVFLRFSELMAGRTAVLVSHRFSTVRMADRIVVLEGGAVVEDGTHDELVGRGGLYAELFQMQAAGYR